MLNNKGFAVSSVLYTLLIAFLLFLGAALAQFSSSSSLIGKANDDIINGTQFEVMQVKPVGSCEGAGSWYKDASGKIFNTVVRIKSRYGTKYWPKDFYGSITDTEPLSIQPGSNSGKIRVTYDDTTIDSTAESYPGYANFGKLTFTDDNTGDAQDVIITDICQ